MSLKANHRRRTEGCCVFVNLHHPLAPHRDWPKPQVRPGGGRLMGDERRTSLPGKHFSFFELERLKPLRSIAFNLPSPF
jgi:hypothetical protein